MVSHAIMLTLVVDNLDPSVSNDEIKVVISVPVIEPISVEPDSLKRYLQFHSYHDANIAKRNLNGKKFLGKVIHAYLLDNCVSHLPNASSGYHQQDRRQQPALPLTCDSRTQNPSHHYGHGLHPPSGQPAPLILPSSQLTVYEHYHQTTGASSLQPPHHTEHHYPKSQPHPGRLRRNQSQHPLPSLQDSPPHSRSYPDSLASAACSNPHQASNLPNPLLHKVNGSVGIHFPKHEQTFCYPVKVTGLQQTITQKVLYDLFSQAGEVLGSPVIQFTEQTYAYINFKQESGAKSAVERFHGSSLLGRMLKVTLRKSISLDQTSTSNNVATKPLAVTNGSGIVKVCKLPPDITESELKEHFECFGAISSIKIIREHCYAWINYSTLSEAQEASACLNQMNLRGYIIDVTAKKDPARSSQPRR